MHNKFESVFNDIGTCSPLYTPDVNEIGNHNLCYFMQLKLTIERISSEHIRKQNPSIFTHTGIYVYTTKDESQNPLYFVSLSDWVTLKTEDKQLAVTTFLKYVSDITVGKYSGIMEHCSGTPCKASFWSNNWRSYEWERPDSIDYRKGMLSNIGNLWFCDSHSTLIEAYKYLQFEPVELNAILREHINSL